MYGRRLLGLQFKTSLALTSPLNLPAPGRRQPIPHLSVCIDLCFAKRLLEPDYSLRPHFCGTFSQVTGSFAEFLNNASSVGLGFSPHPPVSVWYGYNKTNGFLLAWLYTFLDFVPHHAFGLPCGFLQGTTPFRGFPFRAYALHVSPQFCLYSTGISNLLSIGTTLVLALSPDLPRADQLYLNLRYSAERITSLSLLIPAFSLDTLHSSPFRYCFVCVSMLLYQCLQTFLSFGVVFQPGHFRRRTSRPVSCALFECMAATGQHPGCLRNPTSFSITRTLGP